MRFRNRELLRTALVHRSHLYEHQDLDVESNERLEYLGDAVLTYVSSLYLYRAYPDFQEGELTALRSAAVRAETLATFARQIGLGSYLLLGRGEEKSGGRIRPLLLASAFEALIGAIQIDQGMEAVTPLLERFLAPEFSAILAEGRHENFKSRLQEFTQSSLQATPVYRTVKTSGPSHNRLFTIEVLVNDEVAGQGEGPSKRAGEQAAAREALERLSPTS